MSEDSYYAEQAGSLAVLAPE